MNPLKFYPLSKIQIQRKNEWQTGTQLPCNSYKYLVGDPEENIIDVRHPDPRSQTHEEEHNAVDEGDQG